MDTRKFDKMLKLENALRVSGAARALAPTNWERERATKSYESDKVRFYALLDSLTIGVPSRHCVRGSEGSAPERGLFLLPARKQDLRAQ